MSPGDSCRWTATVWPYRGPLITSGIGDLCDGEFRGKRAAFRVDIGNEGWNFVIASVVGAADPHVTTIDFVNGINRNRLKSKHAAAGIAGPPPYQSALWSGAHQAR